MTHDELTKAEARRQRAESIVVYILFAVLTICALSVFAWMGWAVAQ
jgi:hypothetical protein